MMRGLFNSLWEISQFPLIKEIGEVGVKNEKKGSGGNLNWKNQMKSYLKFIGIFPNWNRGGGAV